MKEASQLLIAGDGDPLLGQVLAGRYQVLRRIAEGGMATLYAARHMVINRPVAIKVLLPELAHDLECMEHFVNEGRAAGTLGHPNIVESTDMGMLGDGTPFLVLELLDGVNLDDRIRRKGAQSVARAAHIGRQIAAAVAAAHAHGIIHRDLKSDNILLVDRNGDPDFVKVFDFGISKFIGRGKKLGKRESLISGTPDFMSPEQILNPLAVDERSDVYSLGMILYHMLTGHLPYEAVPVPEVFDRILDEELPKVTGVRSDLPASLAAYLERMLAKDPDRRPASMIEVEEMLRSVGALVQPRPTPVPVGVAAPMPQAAPPRRAANWRAVASVAAAVVLAGAAVALVRMRPAPQANAATLPAPAPVHVEPAVPPPAAPAPPATGPIGINVVSTAPGAEVTFRGQTVPLPWHAEVTRGTVPEVIRVTAPHYQGRLFWVSLDRQRFMAVDLKPGKGVVEATPAETAVALGETAPTQAPAPHASGPRPLTLAGILGPAPEPVAPAPPVVVAAPPPPAPAPAAEAPRAPAPAPAPVAAPAPVKTPEPVTPTTLPFSSYVTSHRSSGAEPRVPPALLAQISEGHAMAHICVDTNGQVADMRLLRASPGVDDAVRQAVRTWRYRPFMSKGKPIPVCFDMPFEFHRN